MSQVHDRPNSTPVYRSTVQQLGEQSRPRPKQVGYEDDIVTRQENGEMHRCKVKEVQWSDSRNDWEYKLDSLVTNAPYMSGSWVNQGNRMELAKPGRNNPLYNEEKEEENEEKDKVSAD